MADRVLGAATALAQLLLLKHSPSTGLGCGYVRAEKGVMDILAPSQRGVGGGNYGATHDKLFKQIDGRGVVV